MDLAGLIELVKGGGATALAVLVWLELRAFRHELRGGISAILNAPRPRPRRRARATASASPQRPVGD